MFDTYTLMVFLLVIIGLGVIVSEIFIPSAGLLSIIAAGCFCASAFCAWKSWFDPEPPKPPNLTAFWVYVGCMVMGIPAFLATGVYLLPKTALGNRLLAAPQDLATLTPFQEEEQRLTELIEQPGKALTLFSPGGMVQIGREKFHAESEGVMIEADTEVVVVGVKGNRLVVRPLALHQTVAGSQPEERSQPEGSPAEESAPENTEVTVEAATVQPADPLGETVAGETESEAESENAAIDFDIPETT